MSSGCCVFLESRKLMRKIHFKSKMLSGELYCIVVQFVWTEIYMYTSKFYQTIENRKWNEVLFARVLRGNREKGELNLLELNYMYDICIAVENQERHNRQQYMVCGVIMSILHTHMQLTTFSYSVYKNRMNRLCNFVLNLFETLSIQYIAKGNSILLLLV